MNVERLFMACVTVTMILFGSTSHARERQEKKQPSVSHGRYMVIIAGCNDCHTSGYADAEGKIHESLWLTGDIVGWNGAWGTTYPVNLRLLVSTLTEKQWMEDIKHAKARPPMPWYALREMNDNDFRSIYCFIRHLGPAGKKAPDFVPPSIKPEGPYVRYPQP